MNETTLLPERSLVLGLVTSMVVFTNIDKMANKEVEKAIKTILSILPKRTTWDISMRFENISKT